LLNMPRELVKEKLLAFLKEDVGQADITSQLVVRQDALAQADVIAKENGVAAGLEEAQILLEAMGLTGKSLVADGATVKASTILMHIEGNARDLLTVERTLLNVISRMSGIATKTRTLQTQH